MKNVVPIAGLKPATHVDLLLDPHILSTELYGYQFFK
jgi:hypothetical protein